MRYVERNIPVPRYKVLDRPPAIAFRVEGGPRVDRAQNHERPLAAGRIVPVGKLGARDVADRATLDEDAAVVGLEHAEVDVGPLPSREQKGRREARDRGRGRRVAAFGIAALAVAQRGPVRHAPAARVVHVAAMNPAAQRSPEGRLRRVREEDAGGASHAE